MQNRINWADTAKALGMYLVFCGHLLERDTVGDTWLSDTTRLIYAFHMPFFFILAGYFYREQKVRFGSLLVQKIKTRLVPAVFFDVLTLPFWQHPYTWGITNVDPENVHLHLWLLARGVPNLNWPCWFLVCLFVAEMLASEIIPVLTTRLRQLAAIVVIYIAGRMLTDNYDATAVTLGISSPWWFAQEAVVALSFYLAGVFLKQQAGILLPGKRLSWLLLLAALPVYLYSGLTNFATGGHVNMSSAGHGSWLLFPLGAIAGSLILIHLSAALPLTALLRYIGNNTLPLLGLNGFLLHFFNGFIYDACRQIAPEGAGLLVVLALAAALSLLACLPLVYLLDKAVPFLIGKWR
jgi:fucose 4-O-acetylase-like acetyltransferase